MTDQAIRQSAGGRSLPHSSCRKKANGKRKLALTPVTAVAPRSRLLDRNFRAPSVIADLPIFIPLRFHQLLQEFCEGARNDRPIRTPVYWKSNGDRTKVGLLWIACNYYEVRISKKSSRDQVRTQNFTLSCRHLPGSLPNCLVWIENLDPHCRNWRSLNKVALRAASQNSRISSGRFEGTCSRVSAGSLAKLHANRKPYLCPR